MLSFVSASELGIEYLTDVEPWIDPATERRYLVTTGWDATVVLDVTDPVNPVIRFSETIHDAIDIKIRDNLLYVLTESDGSQGAIRVYRMTDLVRGGQPDPVAVVREFDGGHNLSMSRGTNYAYASLVYGGAGACKSLLELDLSDAESPVVTRCLPDSWERSGRWSHNAQCGLYGGPDTDFTGRELCFMSVPQSGLVIQDVTNKAAGEGTFIGSIRYPDEWFAHQGELTSDGRYFLMGDEGWDSDRPRMIIVDVAVLSDPVIAGYYFAPWIGIDHDLEIHGSRIYWSLYKDGIRILEFRGPDDITEVGWFDTASPAEQGTWDTAVLPDGVLAATAGRKGLYILTEAAVETGIASETPLDWAFSVYPNPASSLLQLSASLDGTSDTAIRIIDVAGRELMERRFGDANSALNIEMDISMVPIGTYLVVLESGGQRASRVLTIRR
jgi:choice-of-anchor B domain-containing protein